VQTRGDTARAQQLLGEAREWIARVEIPPATQLAHLVGCLRTALARHDHDAAQAIVDDMDPLESYRSFPDAMAFEVARGRLLLARGRYAEAAQRLAGVRAMADAAGACYISAQLVALQALAAPHPDAAMVFLAEALVAAESMGLVRTYLDAGEPMAALLRDAQACGIAPEATRRLLAAFEAQGAPAPEPPGPTSIVLPYGETLSERELEMLRGLADGLTNREIAQSLYLSVNTVKTHLRNLYGKLGVSTRRDAVATARKLGLLQF